MPNAALVMRQGDTAQPITGQLTLNGSPFAIDPSATVTLWGIDSSGAVKIDGTCDVTDAATGKWSYQLTDTDVATAGQFTLELRVEWSAGKLTFPNGSTNPTLTLTPQLATS